MSADTRASLLRDRVAYARLVDLRERSGPERMVSGATRVRGTIHAIAMLMVARGAGIDEVIDTLHLEPGGLARACPAPTTTTLPPGETATTFPDDDDDALPAPLTAYAARTRAVLLDEVREPAAATLARLVGGKRGLILFAIARGDDREEIAGMLKINPAEVEAILAEGDGMHLDRPDR